MSWSVSAIGKGAAVGSVMAAQFAKLHKMEEPEQSMCQSAAEMIAAACDGVPNQGLIVRAEGSQWTDVSVGEPNSGKVRGLHLKVEIDVVALAE